MYDYNIRTLRLVVLFVGGEEFLLEGEDGGFGDKRCR